jgi:ankyrin repeat protein
MNEINIAISMGYYDHTKCLLEKMIEKRIDVNTKTSSGYTPLHTACHRKHGKKYISLLLQRGANPNVVNIYGWAPINLAAYNRCKFGITLLLKAGANPYIVVDDDPLIIKAQNCFLLYNCLYIEDSRICTDISYGYLYDKAIWRKIRKYIEKI